MKLNIRNPFRRAEAPAGTEDPKPFVKLPPVLTPKMVWEAPADFNRATRRWAKLWGRIWKWDREALGVPADLPPRYARRHFKPEVFLFPKTRRQRRHRARIVRAMRQRGVSA